MTSPNGPPSSRRPAFRSATDPAFALRASADRRRRGGRAVVRRFAQPISALHAVVKKRPAGAAGQLLVGHLLPAGCPLAFVLRPFGHCGVPLLDGPRLDHRHCGGRRIACRRLRLGIGAGGRDRKGDDDRANGALAARHGILLVVEKEWSGEREQTIRQSTMPGLYGICAAGKRIKRSREDRTQRAATAFVPRATAGDLSFGSVI